VLTADILTPPLVPILQSSDNCVDLPRFTTALIVIAQSGRSPVGQTSSYMALAIDSDYHTESLVTYWIYLYFSPAIADDCVASGQF
jgi:hypothetical protein